MEAWEREIHAARVVSGVTRVRVGGVLYRAGTPSREARLAAAELYRDVLREGELGGLIRADEVPVLLTRLGLWSASKASDMVTLEKAVEDGKVGLFENANRSDARAAIRRTLAALRAKLSALEEVLHGIDHMTAEAAAASSKFRFLTGCSLVLPDGSPYWPDPDADWHRPDGVVDAVMAALAECRLDEAGVRELARTEPWLSVWGGRECGLFGVPAADLREEQLYLVRWSTNYERIRAHPECPTEDVIGDDDALDGWMIVQRRRHEDAVLGGELDAIRSQKIRDADEVYLMADTPEDARRIDRHNGVNARNIKAQRLAQIREHGELDEMTFSDTQQRLRMAMTRSESMGR